MHKLHPIRESFEKRFWKYVQKTDGCWLWTGFLDKNRRGHLRRGRANEGQVQASVASWIVHFGQPVNGFFVLHSCDNPQCVRPDHLFLGTQADNVHDMVQKGRHWMQGKGEAYRADKNPNSRLTWENVQNIRSFHSQGVSGAEIARRFGVTKENIYVIVRNRSWVV